MERLSVGEALSTFSHEDIPAIRISIGASLVEQRFQLPEGTYHRESFLKMYLQVAAEQYPPTKKGGKGCQLKKNRA